jgi:diketogulonate reductase-like aldo/keto reductase
MSIFDFELTQDEVDQINSLDRGLRLNNKFPLFNNYDIFA